MPKLILSSTINNKLDNLELELFIMNLAKFPYKSVVLLQNRHVRLVAKRTPILT